ncbi:acyl-CoA thioesterase [Mycetocola reblochoni]|uniref:Acyl-CoA thioesterase 2 n=2 Tax=Mycetocola reblochoni TaxID=331618 RepID=A0A1R4JD69_9MICO|nr:acyl-CoA thioesterase II [Mycetocola reblochoni]RLP69949.1 acyl-CoA thioesterase II [Mycetocola reblochoni]SJN29929.1 Acyl-CoA thioesterase II [Mycetocola reblochoni REB411]
MTPDPVHDLLRVLDLVDTGARTSEDIFTGPSQWSPLGRVFGGQVLAQSIMAATRTIEDERPVHSMHGYFLRPGDVDAPITFSVDRIHDGRSFSTRRTQAYQHGRPILSLIASFQSEDDGVDHQLPMPADLPDPDSLPTALESLGRVAELPEAAWALGRPFDIRHVDGGIYLSVDQPTPHQAVWLRSTGPLPDDPALHRAALAYVSDYTMLEPVMRAHGVSWATPGIRVASLDHAMWWHRDARVDDWLLYVQESTNAHGGRGLTHGRIYDRQGRLVASVAQEGMTRIPELRRDADD